MDWGEFSDLVSGLTEQTPLIRLAQVRTERDRERIKNFTTSERRIYNEWQTRKAKEKTRKEVEAFQSDLSSAFSEMFGVKNE